MMLLVSIVLAEAVFPSDLHRFPPAVVVEAMVSANRAQWEYLDTQRLIRPHKTVEIEAVMRKLVEMREPWLQLQRCHWKAAYPGGGDGEEEYGDSLTDLLWELRELLGRDRYFSGQLGPIVLMQ